MNIQARDASSSEFLVCLCRLKLHLFTQPHLILQKVWNKNNIKQTTNNYWMHPTHYYIFFLMIKWRNNNIKLNVAVQSLNVLVFEEQSNMVWTRKWRKIPAWDWGKIWVGLLKIIYNRPSSVIIRNDIILHIMNEIFNPRDTEVVICIRVNSNLP